MLGLRDNLLLLNFPRSMHFLNLWYARSLGDIVIVASAPLFALFTTWYATVFDTIILLGNYP